MNGEYMTKMTYTDINKNSVYHDDNMIVLPIIPMESIDLVYIDPPFKSNRRYGDKQGEIQFDDKFDTMDAYIAFIEPRLRECWRVLKSTGSIYVHCDYHASRYIGVLCDKIFGYDHFINEIIWQRSISNSLSKRKYDVVTDTIYFYSKGDDYIFNPQVSGTIQRTSKNWKYDEKTKQYYHASDLTSLGFNRRFSWRGRIPGNGRSWAYSRERLEEFFSQGRILTDEKDRPLLCGLISYSDELPLVRISNLWTDFYNIAGKSSERTEYPTQKPLPLLRRIIETSTNDGDIILDPFCGSGTSLVAAKVARRRYTGIDNNEKAINITIDRLNKASVMTRL